MVRRLLIRIVRASTRLRAVISTADSWWLRARIEFVYRVRRANPVLIFQIGKVGSSSVAASFPTRRHPLAIQTHHLHRPQIEAMRQLQQRRGRPVRRHYYRAETVARRVMETGRPYEMVTLVREPIDRAMSKFFQAFDEYVEVPEGGPFPTVEQLGEIFVSRYAQLNEAYWFEREFEPAVGIDVYAHPFPFEQGYQRIPTSHGEVLILRIELDDAEKERAIRDFLDDPDFVLGSANTGETKHYAGLYGRFRREVVLPMRFVDRMLDSRYAQHFYSAAERQVTRDFWVERAGATRPGTISAPGSPGDPRPTR